MAGAYFPGVSFIAAPPDGASLSSIVSPAFTVRSLSSRAVGVAPSCQTFALKLPSKNEFVGTDNVRRREVRYRRVPAGTLP